MGKFIRKTREERSLEIIAAAREVFLEKGYRYATMEDIIGRTSLSKGGVYRYYGSTKEILMDMMVRGNEFRSGVLRGILADLEGHVSLNEIILSMLKNKLYDKNVDKQIYAMFIAEMIYDGELQDLFYRIEDQCRKEFFESLAPFMSQVEKDTFDERYYFLSRMINGLIFTEQVFEGEDMLLNNRDRVDCILADSFVLDLEK